MRVPPGTLSAAAWARFDAEREGLRQLAHVLQPLAGADALALSRVLQDGRRKLAQDAALVSQLRARRRDGGAP